MSTRLIIEGNAVYEIDEDCQTCNKMPEKGRAILRNSGYEAPYEAPYEASYEAPYEASYETPYEASYKAPYEKMYEQQDKGVENR